MCSRHIYIGWFLNRTTLAQMSIVTLLNYNDLKRVLGVFFKPWTFTYCVYYIVIFPPNKFYYMYHVERTYTFSECKGMDKWYNKAI